MVQTKEQKAISNKKYRETHKKERAEYQKNWKKNHRKEEMDSAKQHYKNNKKEKAEYDKKYRKNHRKEHNARQKLNIIVDGSKEPFIMEDCAFCEKSSTIKHHENYDEPYFIYFLCKSCHMNYHRNGIVNIKIGADGD